MNRRTNNGDKSIELARHKNTPVLDKYAAAVAISDVPYLDSMLSYEEAQSIDYEIADRLRNSSVHGGVAFKSSEDRASTLISDKPEIVGIVETFSQRGDDKRGDTLNRGLSRVEKCKIVLGRLAPLATGVTASVTTAELTGNALLSIGSLVMAERGARASRNILKRKKMKTHSSTIIDQISDEAFIDSGVEFKDHTALDMFPLAMPFELIHEAQELLDAGNESGEPWSTTLRPLFEDVSAAQNDLIACRNEAQTKLRRQGFTDVDEEVTDSNKQLQDAEDSLKAAVAKLRGVYAELWDQQRARQKESEKEEFIHELASSLANVDVAHSNYNVLIGFENAVFALLSNPANTEKVTKTLMNEMQGYVKSMSTHLTSDDQAHQFYLGFVNKFGEAIEIPDWDTFSRQYLTMS